MIKYKVLQDIKQLYDKGENIMEYLKNISNKTYNDPEEILISYDIQSGIYIKNFFENYEQRKKIGESVANVINNLVNNLIDYTIIEVGVGEATTLGGVIKNLNIKPNKILGFDISWSRLKYAKEFLHDLNIKNVSLFTANLFEIPLMDNSIDVVYTYHSVEPNGGKELDALKELFRITNKYLILIEPSYKYANNQAKQRMKKHGYITELYNTAKKNNYNIIDYKLFEYQLKPELNPTEIIIIKKENNKKSPTKLICPISYTNLTKYNKSFLYSKKGMLAYPMLDGIPCLLKENAILATHLLTDYQKFKQNNNIK